MGAQVLQTLKINNIQLSLAEFPNYRRGPVVVVGSGRSYQSNRWGQSSHADRCSPRERKEVISQVMGQWQPPARDI
jgi:hypothetical protein